MVDITFGRCILNVRALSCKYLLPYHYVYLENYHKQISVMRNFSIQVYLWLETGEREEFGEHIGTKRTYTYIVAT